jgi:hypothetical protein
MLNLYEFKEPNRELVKPPITHLEVSLPLPNIKKAKSQYLELVDFALGKPIA